MSIVFDEKNAIFRINTPNTSCVMGIYAKKHLLQLYYGSRLDCADCSSLFPLDEFTASAHTLKRGAVDFFGTSPFVYPATGTGDYRNCAITVVDASGHRVCQLEYDRHRIYAGKPKLSGMPATFGDNCQTLEITMRDTILGLKVLLRFTVFADSDAIIRSAVAVNEGNGKLYLERMLSACLDMPNEDYELTTLHGTWARERNMVSRPITEGCFSVGSVAGKTSHENHPFLMVTSPGADQKHGNVYGINLIYSGNFLATCQRDHLNDLRLTMGIHPEGFRWVLEPGACFETPEAVLVFSDRGIGSMTRTFHNLYRGHLIRSPWLHRKRPILINNWEATYFNFDEEKLVAIAREAKKVGIELLVMDDGWFGHRDNDESSLGDWKVNPKKLPGGLESLEKRIRAEGLQLGIWFEPEMISPDSELYRSHPDWAIQVPGREINMSRHQYVLDLTRQDVREYVYESVAKVLRSADIRYVKWDMNRNLCDIGSAMLDSEHMGEFFHRYVLGVYWLQERLLAEFPELLLENCAGGGGRFDPGMLYYSPQIWTSDNMDPIQRLLIQEGTALVYPLSTMGAHVCVSPNHCNGRMAPLHTRANVALSGTFGYELDITKLSDAERAQCAEFIKMYHAYQEIYREGDYYRIASFRKNGYFDCWQVVSADRQQFLLTYVQARYESRPRMIRLQLEGLESGAIYRLVGTDKVYSGDLLMKAGYPQAPLWGDGNSVLLHFEKVSD